MVGHKEDGDPIFQYVLAPTQKALLPKLHQNIEVFRDVELCEDSRMTLAQWLDRWLDEYAALRLRESTMSGYRMYAELMKEGRVREHPEHGRTLSAGTIKTDGGFETGETKTGQGRRKILLLQSTRMSFGKGSGKLSANGFSPT